MKGGAERQRHRVLFSRGSTTIKTSCSTFNASTAQEHPFAHMCTRFHTYEAERD